MANPIDSYDDLVQACKEAIEDDSQEFENFLPVAINNAELKITKETDIIAKVQFATVTAATSTAFVSKPDNYRVGRTVSFTDEDNRRTVLRKKTNDFLDVYWPVRTSVGVPKYYADYDEDNFVVAPAPTSAVSNFIIEYEGRPTPLSSSNQTNAFTDTCPDLLFYATMLEVAGTYSRNQQLFTRYAELYAATRDAINNESRRGRRDDGIPVNNPELGQNTLGSTGVK